MKKCTWEHLTGLHAKGLNHDWDNSGKRPNPPRFYYCGDDHRFKTACNNNFPFGKRPIVGNDELKGSSEFKYCMYCGLEIEREQPKLQ